MWAFGYEPHEASRLWDQIPLDSDIVVTHTPAKYHCDERKDRRAVGCETLRTALWRVRPRLAVCGHVHEGRGAERIRWDLRFSNHKYKESGVESWTDPGKDNKKMSLVDLTSKAPSPIDNDGSIGDLDPANLGISDIHTSPATVLERSDVAFTSQTEPQAKPNAKMGISQIGANLLALPAEVSHPATWGQGGMPPSQRCDLEALSGKLGRRETCVVNAAIMASSWPRGPGGKKFNKPIVVDVDLPVWEE